MAIILAIETATKLCSVAIGRDGALIAQREIESERGAHAEKVNVFIAEVLREAGLAPKDLDAVAVGIGPGSYTGLRIGLSAAKGLCYALDIPIIGINSLTTIVRSAMLSDKVLIGLCWPMIDARRMEVFTQEHDTSGIPKGEVVPLILEEAWATSNEARNVFGDGADKATELWAVAEQVSHLPGIKPHASAMLKEADRRLTANEVDDLAYLVPAYGKEANVTQPKRAVR